jgi:hypothetical protein
METATVIAIGIVVVVIPVRAAATTDALLTAANSAAAVRAHCHCSRVGGHVGGVAVNNNAVPSDALAAPLLPPSGAKDPMAMATMKTRDSTASAVAATEEEEYNRWEGTNPDTARTILFSTWCLADEILLRSITPMAVDGSGGGEESGNHDDVNARNQR